MRAQIEFLKILKYNKLCKYQNLCFQSDAFLLDDVLNNFGNMVLGIYGLYPAHFFSSPRLVQLAALEKIKIKLDLSTDTVMLKMLEKSVRGGFAMIFIYIKKLIIRKGNVIIKKESSYPKYLGVNNFHRWKMPRKFA